MKKIMILSMACVLTISVSTGVIAQTTDKKDKTIQTLSKTDAEMNKKLSADIVTRFPMSKNNPIVWDNTDNGYVATYSYNKEDYMTRYDKNGSYKGTFVKRDWDTQVPSNTRNFFNNSQYKTLKVGSYWQVKDGEKEGSYIMATNEQGAPQYIFIDEQGQFTENPFDN